MVLITPAQVTPLPPTPELVQPWTPATLSTMIGDEARRQELELMNSSNHLTAFSKPDKPQSAKTSRGQSAEEKKSTADVQELARKLTSAMKLDEQPVDEGRRTFDQMMAHVRELQIRNSKDGKESKDDEKDEATMDAEEAAQEAKELDFCDHTKIAACTVPKIGGLGVVAAKDIGLFETILHEPSAVCINGNDTKQLEQYIWNSSFFLTMKWLDTCQAELKERKETEEDYDKAHQADTKTKGVPAKKRPSKLAAFALSVLREKYRMTEQFPVSNLLALKSALKAATLEYSITASEFVAIWSTIEGYYHNSLGSMTSLSTGFGFYPKLGMFNHSCAPNCLHVTSPYEATVYALRPIKVGEELFITYHLSSQDLPFQMRQISLSERLLNSFQRTKTKIEETLNRADAELKLSVGMKPMNPAATNPSQSVPMDTKEDVKSKIPIVPAIAEKPVPDTCFCAMCEADRVRFSADPVQKQIDATRTLWIDEFTTNASSHAFSEVCNGILNAKLDKKIVKFLMFSQMFTLHNAFGMEGLAKRAGIKLQEWAIKWAKILDRTKCWRTDNEPADLPPEQRLQLWMLWNVTGLEARACRMKMPEYVASQEAALYKLMGYGKHIRRIKALEPAIKFQETLEKDPAYIKEQKEQKQPFPQPATAAELRQELLQLQNAHKDQKMQWDTEIQPRVKTMFMFLLGSEPETAFTRQIYERINEMTQKAIDKHYAENNRKAIHGGGRSKAAARKKHGRAAAAGSAVLASMMQTDTKKASSAKKTSPSDASSGPTKSAVKRAKLKAKAKAASVAPATSTSATSTSATSTSVPKSS